MTIADRRSRREKLEAMASRGTPHEAAVARTKLASMGPPPPRRPTAVAAPPPPPPPGDGFRVRFTYTTIDIGGTSATATGVWFRYSPIINDV